MTGGYIDGFDINLVKRWIYHCVFNHARCEDLHTVLPTRVIDVGSDTNEPRIHVPKSEKGQYVALSHCWGPSQTNGVRLMTLKSSLEQNQAGIPFESFPKTFQDAILFTRLLGLKYLWIDNLCIVQDDRDDWAKESACMGGIYAKSFVTIAADKAASSDEGLFRTEEDPGKRYYRLEFMDKIGKSSFVYVRPRIGMQQNPTLETMTCSADDASSKLETRGWTLQEQLLSPRIVHFNDTEMTWECNTENVCECGNAMGSSKLEKNRVEPDSINNDNTTCSIRGLEWREVVAEYSRRILTYSNDRLPAISGLAATVQATNGSDYIAGLWRSNLPHDLLWYSQTTGSPYFGEEARVTGGRHTTYHAPSWSWASITGPVTFASSKANPLWEILAASTVRSVLNPFGTVTSGRIKVKGSIAEVYIEKRTHLNNNTQKDQVRHFAISEAHPTVKRLQEVVRPDVEPDTTELEDANASFCLLFGAEENGWPFALALKQVPNEDDVYQRVGYVEAKRFPWKQWTQVVVEMVVDII